MDKTEAKRLLETARRAIDQARVQVGRAEAAKANAEAKLNKADEDLAAAGISSWEELDAQILRLESELPTKIRERVQAAIDNLRDLLEGGSSDDA